MEKLAALGERGGDLSAELRGRLSIAGVVLVEHADALRGGGSGAEPADGWLADSVHRLCRGCDGSTSPIGGGDGTSSGGDVDGGGEACG